MFAIVLAFGPLPTSAQKIIFYLHGRIIELQGPNAVDNVNGYGPYRYYDILDTLRKKGFKVMSEARKPDTKVKEYALVVSKQIDSLLKHEVAANDITVIGASKGALIAMYVSTFVKNRDVNYVFMAACSDENFNQCTDITFYGNVLSIYEKSDEIGGSCSRYRNKSNYVSHYKEIELNTGLKHGFLYRPLPEWTGPVASWANHNYD